MTSTASAATGGLEHEGVPDTSGYLDAAKADSREEARTHDRSLSYPISLLPVKTPAGALGDLDSGRRTLLLICLSILAAADSTAYPELVSLLCSPSDARLRIRDPLSRRCDLCAAFRALAYDPRCGGQRLSAVTQRPRCSSEDD